MTRFSCFLLVLAVTTTAVASSDSIGPNGINRPDGEWYDGSYDSAFGAKIGMAEAGRSGKAGYDSPENCASNTSPRKVYGTSGGQASPNYGITDHATHGAGVTIGDPAVDAEYEGVAPKAWLYSKMVADYWDDSLTAVNLQSLIQAANNDSAGHLMGITLAWGVPTDFFEEDGSSLLSMFTDWAERRYDVLFVTAWRNAGDEPSKPDDDFNSITVAASMPVEGETYNMFGVVNAWPDFPPGEERTYIDILAPGEDIDVLCMNDEQSVIGGSSPAAAHVTGAIAVLEANADRRAVAGNERLWVFGDHRVMKAILLNSADKLAGVHGSTRDVYNHIGQKWDETTAYSSPQIPLDAGMGAGHLNVESAVTQMANGRYYHDELIPDRGFADDLIYQGDGHVYELSAPASGWAAITLCWDRITEHTGGNTYNYGDQFISAGLADLDLYLADHLGALVAASVSYDQNVEHIFCNLPEAGIYTILVYHAGGLDAGTEYGLAWWFGEGSIPVPGDYDGNGSVGPEDYDVWKANFGSTTQLAADGNGDGIVDAADYTVWRDNLGAGSGSLRVAMPEPTGTVLSIIGVIFLLLRRRDR